MTTDFTSNSAANDQQTKQENSAGKAPYYSSRSKELQLLEYYKNYFPTEDFYKWLAYETGEGGATSSNGATSPSALFPRREFSFWQGDVVRRYLSFQDGKDFRQALIQRRPDRLEIGPVYNLPPASRQAYASQGSFQPESRELVFDIDLSDYEHVLNTCADGSVCRRAWPLMEAVVAVVGGALEKQFGLKHTVWVFSGRRGVHAWVCDAR